MPIKIPKIIRDMPLSEYAPEMGEAVLKVWVNPDRAFVKRFMDISNTTAASGLFGTGIEAATGKAPDTDLLLSAWYAELLSQGPAGTQVSGEELRDLFEHDPALWGFIATKCWTLIDEHRTVLEKKRATP